ncbi:MAG: hypothetical protein IKN81_04200 [Oscillospiraceae bacterium]|nr:hypothetical protein [Oscillospiraceae bacterium]
MFKSETLRQVSKPAALLFGITFLIKLFCNPYFELFPILFAILIFEVFALITCYYLVICKNKPRNMIWANYVIWTLFVNLGDLAAALSA